MRKPAAVRNILVVADPYTAGRTLLDRLGQSGFAAFDMDDGREALLSKVEAHLGEGDGRPLAVLVETGGSIQEVTAAARDLQHVLATPICVRITRQDRALQIVLEKTGEKYNYATFRKRLLASTRIQSKMTTVLPQGKDAAITEVANEALRKNWKLEMRRLGAYLGITLAIGEEETGLEYETSATLSLADRFRTELANGGKPGNAVQPVLGGGARSGGRKYNEATGNSAQLKMGDKLRPPAITAQQSQAMREARSGGKQSKIPRHSVGGGGGPRQPDPGKGPVMGERTRAAKNKQQIVAKPVGREEGMNAARQLSRRPVGESSATAKAQHDAAQVAAQAEKKKAPLKTKGEGSNGGSGKGYWDGRKDMSYYEEAVKLARKYAPNARTVLDVGGRDCLYTLDIPADRRVTVDPDRGPQNPGIQWVQADFMKWQADQIYDVALCLQVMEHVQDAANFLKKLLMVARVVVVSVPFNWPPTPEHKHHRLKSDVFENWAGRKPDYLVKVKENGRPPSYSKRVMAVFLQNFPAPTQQAAPQQTAQPQTTPVIQGAQTPVPQATPPGEPATASLAPTNEQPPTGTPVAENAPGGSSNGSEAAAQTSAPIPQIQIQRDDPHPF